MGNTYLIVAYVLTGCCIALYCTSLFLRLRSNRRILQSITHIQQESTTSDTHAESSLE